ncbi:hypothetical protein GCM10010275_40490 [Streptomyces litmocidini]|nr:hypothetical protein GCM10010275_40490 [Streptomyces litmocidini]
MDSARFAVNVTSYVLHGKTSWSGSVDGETGLAGVGTLTGFAGVAGVDGFDDSAGVVGFTGAEGVAAGGVAAGTPVPPAAPSSEGPQAVRASADAATRTTAALRTELMVVLPPMTTHELR